MKVHQLLSGAGAYDAITSEAIAFRSYFDRWGWGGGDYAVRITPGVGGAMRPRSGLAPDPDDVLLIHHSAGVPRLHELLALPNPKLLLYHNITPPNWLWEVAPIVAAHCAVGRGQLPELVARAHLAAADSAFNAAELRALGAEETTVIPLLIDLDRLGSPQSAPEPGAPTVLFVGRLSPHKRQDEVIRCFALYRRHHAPGARLVLVGDPITPQYSDGLRRLADSLAPGAVQIESGLTPEALGERYRSAHAFLCLSEHEGFCIPLVEAFHFGLPVIARPTGAIPDTAGDAALLLDEPDRAVVAELLHLAVSDQALRAELRRRAAARLEVYSPDAVAERLREAIEQTVLRAHSSHEADAPPVLAVP